jgi:hypothetical protein
MRAAFFALLFVNLVVFAWSQWWSPAAAPAATVATAARGSTAAGASPSRILLASERPTAPAAPPATEQAGLPPAIGTAPADAGLSTVALEGGVASPGPAATAEALRCVSMGPFSGPELTAQATAMLKQDGYEPRQRPANGAVPDGYMVMIGPLPNEAAQERIVRRLGRGGLDDAFALPKLEDGYAVSVGLFSARQRAERRVLAVERMGLKASVVERTRPGTVYWLDFDLKTPAGAPGAPDPLLQPTDPAQTWQLVPCPEPRPVG